MCDTFVVMPSSSKNHKTWFAKNSDRSPNEPNLIIYTKAKEYNTATNPTVKLTYISIPQVESTNSVLMVKPSWTWGCEMGINNRGVTIGNEAVFNRHTKGEDSLIGMDICRLVLERCSSAFEGMRMIGELIVEYGQGGNCGFDSDFHYDNSFIIADSSEAYVVETFKHSWVGKKIDDLYAISNVLTIEKDWDYCSENLSSKKGKLNFTKYNDVLRTYYSGGGIRRFEVCLSLLDDRDGPLIKTITGIFLGQQAMERGKAVGIDYESCRGTLRRHREDGGAMESPCMHYGGLFSSQTTGSMICCAEDNFVSVTGGSAPCRSVFKQFSLEGELPFGDNEDEATQYWLRRELIQRNILGGKIERDDYLRRAAEVEKEIDLLADALFIAKPTDFNRRVFDIEDKFVAELFDRCSVNIDDITPKLGNKSSIRRWREKNKVFLSLIAEHELR